MACPSQRNLSREVRQLAKFRELVGQVLRLMQPGSGPDNDLRRNDPPRLMPSDAGRHVNAMPSHAMAAGGRPMIIKIPGK